MAAKKNVKTARDGRGIGGPIGRGPGKLPSRSAGKPSTRSNAPVTTRGKVSISKSPRIRATKEKISTNKAVKSRYKEMTKGQYSSPARRSAAKARSSELRKAVKADKGKVVDSQRKLLNKSAIQEAKEYKALSRGKIGKAYRKANKADKYASRALFG